MIAGFQENIKNKAKGIKKALLGLRREGFCSQFLHFLQHLTVAAFSTFSKSKISKN